MKKHHNVSSIRFDEDNLYLTIDGKKYTFRLTEISDKLGHASEIELRKYQVSSSGYGIHWPLLDEDLSIDGLLGVKHSPTKLKETLG